MPIELTEQGLVKLSKSKRKEIAQVLFAELDSSDMAKGDLPRRWERNEQIYRVEPGVTNLHLAEGMEGYALPLWRAKADRIIGAVYAAITGLYPYCQAICTGERDKNYSELEGWLQVLSHRGQFDLAFKHALKISVNTNIGVLKAVPDERTGVKFSWVHPKDLDVYPADFGSFAEAKTIGEKFYELKYRVQRKQQSGLYYSDVDAERWGDDDPQEDPAGRNPTHDKTQTTPIIPGKRSERIQLHEEIAELDLGDGYQRYLVTGARTSREILAIKPYELSRPWYFDLRYDAEGGQVWPSDSPAQTMQGINLAYNDLHTTLIHGSYMGAFPMVWVTGGALPTAVRKYGPAMLLETPLDIRVQMLSTQFNPGALPIEGEKLEELADAVTKISKAGTGAEFASHTTATAAAGILAAQQEGKDTYTSAISPVIEQIWEFMFEICKEYYPQVSRVLANEAQIPYEELSAMTPIFESTGKSGMSSPQTLMQKLQFLASLAGAPNSQLDYEKIEERIVNNLDLGFAVSSVKKQAGSPAELRAVLLGLINGTITPEDALQLIGGAMPDGRGGMQEGSEESVLQAGEGGNGVPPAGLAGVGLPMSPGG